MERLRQEDEPAAPQVGLPIFEQWRAEELMKPISPVPSQASPPTD